MTGTVYNAQAFVDGDRMLFVSLDGEHWLASSRPAEVDDLPDVRRMFEGDGDFRPMTFTRAFLANRLAATFHSRTTSDAEVAS